MTEFGCAFSKAPIVPGGGAVVGCRHNIRGAVVGAGVTTMTEFGCAFSKAPIVPGGCAFSKAPIVPGGCAGNTKNVTRAVMTSSSAPMLVAMMAGVFITMSTDI